VTDAARERIQSHTAHASTVAYSEALLQALELSDISTEQRAILERAQFVVAYLSTNLKSADPWLLAVRVLNNLNAQVTTGTQAVQAFVNDHNDGYVATVDQASDDISLEMRWFPSLPPDKTSEATARATTTLLESIRSTDRSLRGKLNTLEGQIGKALERAVAVEADISANLATFQSTANKTTSDSEAKLAELRTEVDSQKARLDQAISQQQGLFAEEQTRRTKDFADSQQVRDSEYADKVDEMLRDATAKLQARIDVANKSIKNLQDHDAKAAGILGSAAASVTAGAYLTDADDQRRQADLWRRMALAIGLLFFAASVAVSLLAPPGDDLSASDLVIFGLERIPAGAVLGTIFYYAFGQSSEHRSRERQSRQLSKELSTFRPFLVELPEKERNEAIAAASVRYFPGQRNDDAVNSEK
jgi:hypothetical protein